eukprot:sb/3475235/
MFRSVMLPLARITAGRRVSLYTIREAYNENSMHVPYPGLIPEEVPLCLDQTQEGSSMSYFVWKLRSCALFGAKLAPRGANLAPRGDISAPNGAKIWRLRFFSVVCLGSTRRGAGKRPVYPTVLPDKKF